MGFETERGLGVRVQYGEQTASSDRADGRDLKGYADTQVLQLDFDYLDVNSGGDLTSARDFSGVSKLLANSYIIKATLEVTTAWTSGGAATLDIGLVQPDGTAIDPDGIDEDIALSALNAVGKRVLCNGALVGNVNGIGAADAQVIANAVTAQYTAGAATLVIEYHKL